MGQRRLKIIPPPQKKEDTRQHCLLPRTQWLTHPLHPGVLENLGGAETQSGVPDQQLGYEIFGGLCDVSPVLLWELVLALLDALKQVTLWVESRST